MVTFPTQKIHLFMKHSVPLIREEIKCQHISIKISYNGDSKEIYGIKRKYINQTNVLKAKHFLCTNDLSLLMRCLSIQAAVVVIAPETVIL